MTRPKTGPDFRDRFLSTQCPFYSHSFVKYCRPNFKNMKDNNMILNIIGQENEFVNSGFQFLQWPDMALPGVGVREAVIGAALHLEEAAGSSWSTQTSQGQHLLAHGETKFEQARQDQRLFVAAEKPAIGPSDAARPTSVPPSLSIV